MNRKEYNKIKQATIKILREYNVISEKDFYEMDEELSCVLYENLKAGILEEFDIDDDEMNDLLNDILESDE